MAKQYIMLCIYFIEKKYKKNKYETLTHSIIYNRIYIYVCDQQNLLFL